MPDPRKLARWTRVVLTSPPRETLGRARERVESRFRATRSRRRDGSGPTYLPITTAAASSRQLVGRIPDLAGHAQALVALAAESLDHRFDLLGSGWVEVRHGASCAGLAGHRYPPGPAVDADSDGAWLRGRVTEANEAEARRIWRLVDPGYVPIDWQLDFKSGFRWSELTGYRDTQYGGNPGADVKVPWELARMQHLPPLALTAADARRGEQGAEAPGPYEQEFRNEVLDFIAANPPRFGVNWAMTMDVAIRVANWIVAYDLFRISGATFDETFEGILWRSVLEHARHIVENLEWSSTLRSNHYLADVVGLLFAATWLPRSSETDAWMAFAAGEVVAESYDQFLPDGGSFEASTGYHRLSGEMVVYGLALLLGLPDDHRAAIGSADPQHLPRNVRRRVRPVPADILAGTLPPDLAKRLERMAELVMDITTPAGSIVQVGDFDGGRFLKLLPSLRPVADLAEDHLDHRHLVGAIAGLVDRPDLAAWAGPWTAEGDLVASLARGARARSGRGTERSPSTAIRIGRPGEVEAAGRRWEAASPDHRRRFEVPLRGDDARRGLRLAAYPGFGVFVMRSDRVFLTIRCGPVGQRGAGGHAHNDQLSVEVWADGEALLRDPGTYVYTPLPERRNAYRSANAHAGPRLLDGEPASLDVSPFLLGPGTDPQCLAWGEEGFVGRVNYSRGRAVEARIRLLADRLVIEHRYAGCRPGVDEGADWTLLRPAVLFSPGYGLLDAEEVS